MGEYSWIIAGACGAFASAFAKLLSSGKYLALSHTEGMYAFVTRTGSFLFLLVAVVVSNIFMLHNFNDALRRSNDTVSVVTCVLAVNVILSTMLGLLFFNEACSLTWLFGATLVILGVYLLRSNVDD